MSESRLRRALELETRPPSGLRRLLAEPEPRRAGVGIRLAGVAAVLVAILAVGTIYAAAHARSATRTAVPPTAAPSPAATPVLYRVGQPGLLGPTWFVSATDGWTVSGAKSSGVLLHTTDGGAHWSRDFQFAYGAYARDLSFVDPQHGYLTNLIPGRAGFPSDEIWATADGTHWEKRTVPAGTTGEAGLSFVSADEGYGLFQANGGPPVPWHTTDGARTWTRVEAAGLGAPMHLEGIRFWDASRGLLSGTEYGRPDPTSPGLKGQPVFYLTEDGGATFTRVDLPAPPGVTWPATLGVVDQPHLVSDREALLGMSVAGALAVWTTADGGRTWAYAGTDPSAPLAFTAVDPQHWWVAARDGLRWTADAGRTWSSPVLPPELFGNLDFVDAQNGYASSGIIGSAVYRTADGGRTWARLST